MDIQTLQEFAKFCHEIDNSKPVKTFYRLVQGELTADLQTKIREACQKTFSVVNFSDIKNTDVLVFKTGFINLGRIQSLLTTDDDKQAFNEYIAVFRKLYETQNVQMSTLLESLDLPPNSPESLFMKKLFNELGSEFTGQLDNFNIEAIMPKVAGLMKNGRIMTLLTEAKDGNFKMSRVLMAVGKLFQQMEDKE